VSRPSPLTGRGGAPLGTPAGRGGRGVKRAVGRGGATATKVGGRGRARGAADAAVAAAAPTPIVDVCHRNRVGGGAAAHPTVIEPR